MPVSGKYGLRINGAPKGDPSNLVAVLRAVEQDRATKETVIEDAAAEAVNPPREPPVTAAPSPATVTATSILAQVKARIETLRIELATFEAKKTELAMLELMLSAEAVAKEIKP